ncbi:MAG: hypothetical protein IT371_02665 [Deltaproteobacteria bacterium]|nr:hypothetical protein [Deltaproteobacteria bacterium]
MTDYTQSRPGQLLGLVGTMCAALSCGSSAPPPGKVYLEVRLRTPATPNPFEGVVRVRLTATGVGMTESKVEAPRSTGEVLLPALPLGAGRVLRLEGLDATGTVLSTGQTAPFAVTATTPDAVTIFFSRVDRFSALEAQLAQPRSGHTATALADGRVLIAGGTGAQGVLASVELYDPQTGRFTRLKDLRRARTHHATARVGDRVAIVGGENGTPLTSVELYHPDRGSEAELQLSMPRAGHTATALPDGTVLVVGGPEEKGKPPESAEVIDLSAPSVRPAPRPNQGRRDHVAALVSGGKLLIAGGSKEPPAPNAAEGLLDDASLYDGGARSWNHGVAPLPAPRARAAGATLLDGSVLVAGGNGPGASRSAALYRGGSWQTLALTADHVDLAVAPLPRGALVAGGASTPLAEVFEAGRMRPVAGADLGSERRFLTLTSLPDGTVLAVGGQQGGTPRGDAFIFKAR